MIFFNKKRIKKNEKRAKKRNKTLYNNVYKREKRIKKFKKTPVNNFYSTTPQKTLFQIINKITNQNFARHN